MTVVDHPSRQVAEVNARIAAEFATHACWKANLLWDEYLICEFGERRILAGRNGPEAFGEHRILLGTTDWRLERDGALLLTGNNAEDDLAAVDRALVGRRLLGVERSASLDLVFSDGVKLRCGRGYGGPLFELRFANDDCVDCYADGTIETERSDQ